MPVQSNMFFDTAEITAQNERALKVVCDEIITTARTGKTFLDQTGNLQSSMGYSVFVNGKNTQNNFKQVLGGSDGVKKGLRVAFELGAKQDAPVTAVIVAGMEYASHVEATGRQVLSFAINEATIIKRMAELLAK